jgi:hypothetical protein
MHFRIFCFCWERRLLLRSLPRRSMIRKAAWRFSAQIMLSNDLKRNTIHSDLIPLWTAATPDSIVNVRHFVMTCFVGVTGGGGAAGEIANVTHAFQPSGRCSAANSL